MKLQVNRAGFESALSTAVACCGREKALPQLGLVHIVGHERGLFFYATDMDRSVRSFLATDEEVADLDIYVEGALLLKIVGKLRGETLALEVKADKLELKGGVTKLNTTIPNGYPELTLCEEADQYHLGFTPAVFTEFGKALLLGTSEDERDEAKAYRNVVQIKASDDTVTGRSTDKVRIAQVIAPCKTTEPVELLIPLGALRTLFLRSSSETEQIRFGQGQNHIFAVYGSTLYSFRKATIKFPDLDLYYRTLKFDRATCTMTTEAFADSLDLAGTVVQQAVTHGARPAIFWEVQDNGIRITTSNIAGEIDEFIECSVEGEGFSSVYNLFQILPIVNQSGAESITLSFSEDNRIAGVDNYPLRIAYETTVKASFDTQSLTR